MDTMKVITTSNGCRVSLTKNKIRIQNPDMSLKQILMYPSAEDAICEFEGLLKIEGIKEVKDVRI